MAESLIRYKVVRVADNLSDTLTAAQIAAFVGAITPATTQEDLQRALLSQVRRILWGDAAPHFWYEDFVGSGVGSLADLTSYVSGRVVGVGLVGTINGVNTIYSTPHKFRHSVGGDTIAVYVNGLRMTLTDDYSVAESGGLGTGYDTVSFVQAPRNGDHLLVDYTRS